MRAIFAPILALGFVLALMLPGCTGLSNLPLPDASAGETGIDTRSELVIKSWEAETGRIVREGCHLRGLTIVCNF